MKDKTIHLKRRNFLLSVGLGGAGAAAGAFGGRMLAGGQAVNGQENSAKGYRLSEHVQNYYRTARV